MRLPTMTLNWQRVTLISVAMACTTAIVCSWILRWRPPDHRYHTLSYSREIYGTPRRHEQLFRIDSDGKAHFVVEADIGAHLPPHE